MASTAPPQSTNSDPTPSTNGSTASGSTGGPKKSGRRGGRGREKGTQNSQSNDDGQQQKQQANGMTSTQDNANPTTRRRPRRRGNRGSGRGGGRGGNNTAVVDHPTSILHKNYAESTTHDSKQSASTTTVEDVSSPPSPRTEQAMQFIEDSIAGANIVDDNHKSADNGTTATQNQHTKKKNETNNNSNQQQQQSNKQKKKSKRNKNNNRSKNNPKSYPWRKYLPDGCDDPISLEPLNKLKYPPFALVVEPPYVPILPGMWPPELAKEKKSNIAAEKKNTNANAQQSTTTDNAVIEQIKGTSNDNNGKERELEILKQQWGEQAVVPSDLNAKSSSEIATTTTSNSIEGRHVNLFDGQVLAYYLVSTLQFIDPNNRRDLTRAELQALDIYLSTYVLGNAGVTDAYDDKGVTLSTAGSAAQSAAGRVQILQEEARSILNSLHNGGGRGNNDSWGRDRQNHQQRPTPGSRRQRERDRDVRRVQSTNSLRDDRHQQQQQQGDTAANNFARMYAAQQGGSQPLFDHQQQPGHAHDTGIYEGEGGGGLLIIDDDINPGLRSGFPVVGSDVDNNTSGLYSAQHIAEHHSHAAQSQQSNFPSLAATTNSQDNVNGQGNNSTSKPPPQGRPSKSLNKISKLVKKTDPKVVERQRKAREEAQRRAERSQLNYFNPDSMVGTNSNTTLGGTTGGALLAAPTLSNQSPSEAVLERNRNLAQALGVAPSTVRNEISLTGWSRPVVSHTSDEFSKELNAAQYPDALLKEAQERMSELLKLEKNWKKFLSNDRDSSCSLKPMARPLRKFVHEYSDFWKLHTESYDPEGRRYVYCKKLEETSAPYPMLSEAARKWRPTAGPAVVEVDINSLPTGPSAANADGWHTEERVPLKLAPRSIPEGAPQPEMQSSMGGMTRSTSTPLLSMTGEVPPPPRFSNLGENERPRLTLAPRSIPTWNELEQRDITQTQWNDFTQEEQEAILIEIEEEKAKQQAQLQREKAKEQARLQRQENKAKKKRQEEAKKKSLLEDAFASSSDDDSDGSDWFEGELEEFDDDEGM